MVYVYQIYLRKWAPRRQLYQRGDNANLYMGTTLGPFSIVKLCFVLVIVRFFGTLKFTMPTARALYASFWHSTNEMFIDSCATVKPTFFRLGPAQLCALHV
jgi:hypothetical protein